MKHEDLDKKFDEWLDQASAEYGKAETRLGFEARIIANVNSRLETRRRRFHWLAIAATATAVLVLSVWVLRTGFQEGPIKEIAFNKTENRKPVPKQNVSRDELPERKAAEFEKKESPGRTVSPDQYRIEPSIGPGLFSSPLSKQEHLLIAYAQSISAESAPDSPDEGDLQPLEIKETVVSPLEIPELEISSIQIEPLEIAINDNEEKL